MAIIIVTVILVFVLGSGGIIVLLLILSALRKKKTIPSAETMRGIPEIPEISDEEFRRKLISLKILTWVRRLTIPVFIVIGFVLFILNIGLTMYLDEFILKVGLPVAIVVVLIVMALYFVHMRISKLKETMGAAIVLPVLREMFEVNAYQPNNHLWRDLISSTGLISSWTGISGSDYIEGSYRGIRFLFSDLHLEHKEGSDHNKKSVTDFKGQWLVCDFGKELSATLRLRERKSGDGFWVSHNVGKSDIETESLAFNKKYQIITEDGHTAFYLLTPHFMERLVALDVMADAQTFFCFMDGKVHIALYNWRDSFELKGVKNVDLDGVRQKFRGDLKYMTDIMDELLLNDRLFKEERE